MNKNKIMILFTYALAMTLMLFFVLFPVRANADPMKWTKL